MYNLWHNNSLFCPFIHLVSIPITLLTLPKYSSSNSKLSLYLRCSTTFKFDCFLTSFHTLHLSREVILSFIICLQCNDSLLSMLCLCELNSTPSIELITKGTWEISDLNQTWFHISKFFSPIFKISFPNLYCPISYYFSSYCKFPSTWSIFFTIWHLSLATWFFENWICTDKLKIKFLVRFTLHHFNSYLCPLLDKLPLLSLAKLRFPNLKYNL